MAENTDDELKATLWHIQVTGKLPSGSVRALSTSLEDAESVDVLFDFIKQREEQVKLKASMQTQFFLMSDLLLEMGPLMVHKHEPGFPEMTAEIIGKVADWRNDKFDEAVKVVIPGKDK